MARLLRSLYVISSCSRACNCQGSTLIKDRDIVIRRQQPDDEPDPMKICPFLLLQQIFLHSFLSLNGLTVTMVHSKVLLNGLLTVPVMLLPV